MRDWLRWQLRLRRNPNFWDWVRDAYTQQDLERLATEATETSLIRPFSPFGEHTWEQHDYVEAIFRRTVRRLYKRYGADIWSACRGLAKEKLGAENPLDALARLELSVQVHDPVTFEEFLVRNALKRAA